MKLGNILSTGQPYKTRLGTNVEAETINGDGTILLGVLLLLVSLITFITYKFEKKKYDRIRKEEEIDEGSC